MKPSRPAFFCPPVDPLLAGLAIALTGVVALCAGSLAGVASPSQLIAGIVASAALGWLVAQFVRHRYSLVIGESALEVSGPPISEACRELVSALVTSDSHSDPVFRELIAARVAMISEQVRDWAHGRMTFTGTEAWRTAYEKVLTAPDISEYRSVAWLKSEHYWQDLPGKHGMQANFELLDRGGRIERILIVGWNLWPPELRLPREMIRRWIDEQHYRGVSVLLVRECDLITEQELLRDFGIYGDHAVGELHVDDESRTVSFTITFEQGAIELAKEQWARLKLFARPYEEALDRELAHA